WTVHHVNSARAGGLLARLTGGADLRGRLGKALDAARPDLVLVAGEHPLGADTIGALRPRSAARWVAWFPHGLESAESLWEEAQAYDRVFASGSDVADLLAERRRDAPAWLAPACDPSVHRPLRSGGEFRANVVFAGRATARREALLAQLVEFGLAVWGPGWRGTSLHDYCRGERMVMDDFLRAYGGASVAVNIHHAAEGALAGRDTGCNRRVFELAAIGAAQVVDDRADLHGAFTEGEEVSVFRSAHELRARVGALLQDLPAAEAMGEAARRRAMREHTYMHRLRALLRAVGFAAGGPEA
ncbi:MAG TPA: glycosyltransferase, partial [Gemmatimonadales bacterium]|nr:glycosyltransferase [Gemmatimonadales bacterium]